MGTKSATVAMPHKSSDDRNALICPFWGIHETKGRFDVNTSLPIAFDGLGRLEVDWLCTDARVAVELDGAQHLADPVAYRRDRRKDQLLQENGYLVLRFLAEDVGKELDLVLDSILRALSHRQASALAVHRLTIARRPT